MRKPRPLVRPLRQALLAFVVATALTVLLWIASGPVAFVNANLPVLVGVVFLCVPVFVAWRERIDIDQFGFTAGSPVRSWAFALGVPAVIFPLFLLVFVGFYQVVCADAQADWLRTLAPPGFCGGFLGWSGLADWRWPKDLLEKTAFQLIVIALPEEFFFRGYLHQRFEQAFGPKRRWLGGGFGWALVLSSLCFAIGHVAVDFDPRRMVVFFPGLLFGWMRSATGSILAPTFCHAASNLYIDALQRTLLR